jgi:hypothetical protein
MELAPQLAYVDWSVTPAELVGRPGARAAEHGITYLPPRWS